MTQQLSFLPEPIDQAFVARFEAKVQRTGSCWIWTGALDRGYGKFRAQGRTVYAHRVAYELYVGPIPDGMTIDHLCRNRACCNPAHLEPVPNRTNQLRGTSPMADNARKAACKRGHPLTGDNLYVVPVSGHRQCQACRRMHREASRVRSAS